MSEKNCRLCLKTVREDFKTIEKALKDALIQLLNLNLHISKEAVMCNECANIIQVFFNFKTTLVMKDRTPFTNINNDVSMNLDEIDDSNNVKPFVDSIEQVKCSFCAQTMGKESLISLNESKENMFLMDMLKQHIPELNINGFEEFLTCQSCLHLLQSLLNFIINWLDVEHKISSYIEIEGTDANDHIDLRNVQQFKSKVALKYEIGCSDINEIKETCDNNEGNFDVKPETETGDLGPNIKTEMIYVKPEFVEIKSEQNDYDGIQESSTEDSKEICSTETKQKINHKQYVRPLEMKKHKCGTCTYETNRKYALDCHLLIHKNPSELTMYKCDKCNFETKHKSSLSVHKVMHRNPSDITTHKCEMCSYETRYRKHLIRHMYTHGKVSNVTMNKCEICGYETRHKSDLNRHVLCHKDPSEVPLHKCELCTYETIHKKNLNRHKLSHKARPKVTTYKCYSCTFETKDKGSLCRHVLTHKDSSEIIMHKCVSCGFETKQKRYLKQHMVTHRDVSEVTKFKCELCPYEAKGKKSLKNHVLIHKEILLNKPQEQIV